MVAFHVDTAVADGLYELVVEPVANPVETVVVAEPVTEDLNQSLEEPKAVEQEVKHHKHDHYFSNLCNLIYLSTVHLRLDMLKP